MLTYPGLDQGYEGPDGDAGDGGGGEDAACPLSPGRIGVHCAVILLNGELGHIRHLEDDDKLQERGELRGGHGHLK